MHMALIFTNVTICYDLFCIKSIKCILMVGYVFYSRINFTPY